MKNKILTLVITALLVTLPGCTNKNNKSSSSDDKPEILEGHYIVEHGLSTYHIVTAKNPQTKEVVAAQELNYFMGQATGVDIPLASEKEVRGNDKFISLGNTTQFKNAFPDLDLSSIDNTLSAYFIATKDDNIYIVSSDDYHGYGVLYAIYDLLHDLVDYTYYHDTEIYYENKDTVNVLNYKNKFVFPSFDGRCLSNLYTMNDSTHGQRLRIINNSRGKEWCKGCYGHSHIQSYLAPWDLDENGIPYGQSHPDWFIFPGQEKPAGSVRGAMIDNGFCYTAGPEFEHIIAQKMIKFIKNEPEAIYVMCAQEDTQYFCQCDRCLRAMEEWGGNTAGLQIAFMNHVIEEVEEWVNENQPGREIQYLSFAYHPTLEPPVKSDGKGGYVRYSDKVIPHEKFRIYVAPIKANYAFDFYSPINLETKQVLDGWKAVAENQIIMYLYDLNYRIYFVNFNNFSSFAGMLKACQEIGTTYLTTQGVSDTYICCFDEMRTYVETSLMWDVKRSYEDLADDFMRHFYKDAYPYMKDIYERIRNRYGYYQTLVQQSTGDLTGDLCNSNLYPYGLVRQLNNDIDLALAAIEPLKATQPLLYNTLSDRVMKEYLSVIYLKMKLYRSNYTSEEIDEMLETFEYYIQKFGIRYQGEGNSIDGIFD